VLLGLRFPRHMRAGEDALDQLWEVAAPELGERYLEDRRGAVARFREANRVTLEGWLESAPGSWSRLYEREAAKQRLRIAFVSMMLGAVFGRYLGALRARTSRLTALASAAWFAAIPPTIWALH